MDGTPTTTARRAPTRHRLLLVLAATALLAAGMLVLAQDETPADIEREAPPVAERWLRARAMHTWSGPRAVELHAPTARWHLPARFEARLPHPALPVVRQAMRPGAALGADTFARWLALDPAALPVVPGLVGRVPEGTEVRVQLYDGDPRDGGELLVSLGYVAGSDDLAEFHGALREAASDATHVVIDVLGRTVALPSAEADESD